MVGTMNWSEELQNRGPNDLYEATALTFDVAEALEFLVHQCQIKDSIIQQLSRTLRNEIGEGWWRKYTDEVKDNSLTRLQNLTDLPYTHLDFMGRVQTLMEDAGAADIPY